MKTQTKNESYKWSTKSLGVLWLVISSMSGGVNGNTVKMPGEMTPYRMKGIVASAIGAAIGTSIGSIESPFQAAFWGGLGGSIGALIGGSMEEIELEDLVGTITGGYIGGFYGGFLGANVGNLADSTLTLLSMTIFGVAGSVTFGEAFGTSGAIGGLIGGAAVGSLVGIFFAGPGSNLVTGSVVGGLGAAGFSFLLGSDYVGHHYRR